METPEQAERYLTERINEAKIDIGKLADQGTVFAKRYSANMVVVDSPDAETDADSEPVGEKIPAHAKRAPRKKG